MDKDVVERLTCAGIDVSFKTQKIGLSILMKDDLEPCPAGDEVAVIAPC